MSNAKQESEPLPISHGDIIQLSQTKLLMHVHEGHATCSRCEPGLNLATGIATDTQEAANVQLTHKQELKQIKKRYGLAEDSELYTTHNQLFDRINCLCLFRIFDSEVHDAQRPGCRASHQSGKQQQQREDWGRLARHVSRITSSYPVVNNFIQFCFFYTAILHPPIKDSKCCPSWVGHKARSWAKTKREFSNRWVMVTFNYLRYVKYIF